MNKYEEFKDIKLEDTKVMKNSLKDTTYYRLYKNNITNLQELFELYDKNLINYGAKSGFLPFIGYLQTIGVVKLLRAHYLKEDLPYLNILDGYVKDGELIFKENGQDISHNFNEIFLSIGFTLNFVISMKDATKNKVVNVKNLLEDTYNGNVELICNKPEKEKNKKRLSFLLEWYYFKKNNFKLITKEDLIELKEKIIELKNKKLNNLEYELLYLKLNKLLNDEIIKAEETVKTLKLLKKDLND